MDDSTTNNFPTGAYKFGTLLVANSGFFGSQYFVPDNFNVDPYIYIRSIGNNGNTFNQWAKIKVNAARKSKVDDNTAKMQSIKWLGV